MESVASYSARLTPIADEYDAAQACGEINRHGGDRKTIKFESSKLESLSPDQIHEARQIRDAEEAQPGIVRAVRRSRSPPDLVGESCQARPPFPHLIPQSGQFFTR